MAIKRRRRVVGLSRMEKRRHHYWEQMRKNFSFAAFVSATLTAGSTTRAVNDIDENLRDFEIVVYLDSHR